MAEDEKKKKKNEVSKQRIHEFISQITQLQVWLFKRHCAREKWVNH